MGEEKERGSLGDFRAEARNLILRTPLLDVTDGVPVEDAQGLCDLLTIAQVCSGEEYFPLQGHDTRNGPRVYWLLGTNALEREETVINLRRELRGRLRGLDLMKSPINIDSPWLDVSVGGISRELPPEHESYLKLSGVTLPLPRAIDPETEEFTHPVVPEKPVSEDAYVLVKSGGNRERPSVSDLGAVLLREAFAGIKGVSLHGLGPNVEE